jgi:KUP system potassium uptake protein
MARALSETSVLNSGAHTGRRAGRDFWALTLGSIGVVYGDIGTSPLYAVRESV